jgi:hypothetical protein
VSDGLWVVRTVTLVEDRHVYRGHPLAAVPALGLPAVPDRSGNALDAPLVVEPDLIHRMHIIIRKVGGLREPRLIHRMHIIIRKVGGLREPRLIHRKGLSQSHYYVIT